MECVAVILFTLVGGLIGAAARADDVTLESVPPVVVKTADGHLFRSMRIAVTGLPYTRDHYFARDSNSR